VLVTVEADYFLPGAQRQCVVVGERGSLAADFGAGTLTLHPGEHRRENGVWDPVESGAEALPTGDHEPLQRELEAFLAACAGRTACPVPAEDGVHALEIAEAATRASRLGRTVAVAVGEREVTP
jgi:predicted dehydrogenase